MLHFHAAASAADLLPCRALPIALAHELMRTKLGKQVRLALLNRIFTTLKPGDKLRCRNELRECLAAKRGETHAAIL